MDKKATSPIHIFFNTSKDILIWDGNCLFCKECMKWIISKGVDKKIFSIPFQEIPYPPMSDEFEKECLKSIQLLKSNRKILTGGDAISEILFSIGYKKIAILMTKPILRKINNYLYFFVAKHRGFLSNFIRKKKVDRNI